MIDVTCLINNVVVTNKIDKLTVTDASKYIGLKNVVAYDIRRRRNDGRYVVRISLVRRRLNTISIFKPFEGEPNMNNSFSTFKNKASVYLGHYTPESMIA